MPDDFENMSLDDLRAFRWRLDRQVKLMEHAERTKAMEAIHEVARKHGYSLRELLYGAERAKKSVSKRYKDPKDSSSTWSGRGRKPRWVQERLNEGFALNDIKI